jgi:hypothetical protein
MTVQSIVTHVCELSLIVGKVTAVAFNNKCKLVDTDEEESKCIYFLVVLTRPCGHAVV